MNASTFCSICCTILLVSSCTVSLINRTIDYTVTKTFNIDQFGVKNATAPPTSGLTFSEQLKTRILNNTKLTYLQDAEEADLLFSGDVTGYQVAALAPQANQTVALQQLTIQLTISYVNTKDETGQSNWTENFSRFANFGADQDLSTVEEQLIEEVYDQVLDDVFNKAFSGW